MEHRVNVESQPPLDGVLRRTSFQSVYHFQTWLLVKLIKLELILYLTAGYEMGANKSLNKHDFLRLLWLSHVSNTENHVIQIEH